MFPNRSNGTLNNSVEIGNLVSKEQRAPPRSQPVSSFSYKSERMRVSWAEMWLQIEILLEQIKYYVL